MILVAVCCAALSGWLWVSPGRGRRRGQPSVPARAADPLHLSLLVESATARACICVVAGCFLGQLLGGTIGAVAGAPAGLALSLWVGRLEPPSVARAREEVDRDLPLALELLAACASVGRAPQESLPVVATAVGGALGRRLDEVTMRLALGADPVAEWRRVSRDRQLGGLGRTMLRSAEYGAPLADGLTRLAEDRRRERRTQTQMRARSVGVKAAGPLAACFLPAFMLIGVVPTVAGSFAHLFG